LRQNAQVSTAAAPDFADDMPPSFARFAKAFAVLARMTYLPIAVNITALGLQLDIF